MTSELATIKTAYEQEGLSPEQIASLQEIDLVAVKAALCQCSAAYRKDCGMEVAGKVEDGLNFSDDELRRVNEVIMDLALSAEDPHLRFKAATYVRDDKKGRKEVMKNLNNGGFNIITINERIEKIRNISEGIKNKALGNGSGGTVDV